eukprot:762559-Hanusia_phi.AAC.9
MSIRPDSPVNSTDYHAVDPAMHPLMLMLVTATAVSVDATMTEPNTAEPTALETTEPTATETTEPTAMETMLPITNHVFVTPPQQRIRSERDPPPAPKRTCRRLPILP